MTFRTAVLASALVFSSFLPATGQEESMMQRYRPAPKGTSDTYIVTLTGNALAGPSYPGADKATGAFYPSLSYRRSDEPLRFSAPDDGISFSIVDDPSVRFGPVFRFQSGRYLQEDRQLFGLRKRDFDVESGLFVEYWPLTFIRARLELRHGFRDDSGFAGNVGVDVVQPFGRFVFSAGPRVYFGDQRYVDRYFGVRPFEAAINGRVTPFYPEAGVTGVGGVGAVTYTWNETWATTGYVSYNRLVRDAADSPIVTKLGSVDQITVGAKLSYSFNFTP